MMECLELKQNVINNNMLPKDTVIIHDVKIGNTSQMSFLPGWHTSPAVIGS